MKSSNKCVALHVSPELQDAMINVREFLSVLSAHAVTNLPTTEYVLVDDSRINLNQIDTAIELLDTIQSAISYNNLQIDIGRHHPVNSIALQSYESKGSNNGGYYRTKQV